jgi:aminoglycoside 3-N-acetyltransferase
MHRTSTQEMLEAIRQLEIPQNRVVIIHSSLLKFGLIEGGAAGAYSCISNALGPEATIVMPAFTWSYGRTRQWDARNTRSEVGALTEYFRKTIATNRSIHPFHSVCAAGPLAESITSEICLSSFGYNSAFQKLYDLDALNLSVGTEFIGGATYLHLGEEYLRSPYRFMKPFPGEVKDMMGEVLDVTFEMYVREITDIYEYDNVWEDCWKDLNSKGLFTLSYLRGSMLALSEVRKTLDTFMGFLGKDPYYCARKILR